LRNTDINLSSYYKAIKLKKFIQFFKQHIKLDILFIGVTFGVYYLKKVIIWRGAKWYERLEILLYYLQLGIRLVNLGAGVDSYKDEDTRDGRSL